MLFTGKGDNGTTQLFGCDQRIAKSSDIAEALGTVDEINSLLGIVKLAGGNTIATDGLNYQQLLSLVQQDLFVIQAELAGADKKMDITRVKKLEEWIGLIEGELSPITSFFVSGGTKLAALCDFARTVARRAERRVVCALNIADPALHPPMFQYMNRLSSLLYALARLANHRGDVKEEQPRY
ncbi:MAG: ATP:cob(I)alamin adenosyltransferase [Candidatus Lloydbacteria bacterium RIFCSPHIGHO2_01_FULL_49_22]|uniref:Corrinoid adenosyltransferase n=1 Tax=Candidatus Lloydbacteria bacterium RIFCSPHIGHO2_01_FULL_49_22 TaxID=1798658 RepID=A0A1G2CVY7_9BACT|nr:MAG: ATP:cob(I)alamin adenosyltransferase [Candidatus Lloydbacteria bacterium RIFCSPHIGHO2_01_FULL_49_22]OGZ09792.1 MAG: ATP:cob(I)alamin adenosyltransferase [Candidatus Lloydbacteria bacterium RIFCSPHIGHO2_02_FULL_50_18]